MIARDTELLRSVRPAWSRDRADHVAKRVQRTVRRRRAAAVVSVVAALVIAGVATQLTIAPVQTPEAVTIATAIEAAPPAPAAAPGWRLVRLDAPPVSQALAATMHTKRAAPESAVAAVAPASREPSTKEIFARADRLRDAGDEAGAMTLLKSIAASDDPLAAAAAFTLGKLLRTRDPLAAKRAFLDAVTLDPEGPLADEARRLSATEQNR